jgi:hypothetical protein
MGSYNDIKELKHVFVSGSFDFPETFAVGENGVEYRYIRSVNHKLEDMIQKGHKAMMIYAVRKNDENIKRMQQSGLQNWIVFLWGFDNKYRMLPYDVRSITQSREISVTKQSDVSEGYKEIDQSRVIPDKVKVMLLDLPVARELVGKVDTGADLCSLHAENIEIHREAGKVSFNCPPLTDNRLTLHMIDQQAISVPSSEETVYRPVIQLNLKIAEKALKEVKVNLNDRSNMDQPFLIGQNALEAGNFLIDPNIIKEEDQVDDEALIEMLTEEFSNDKVETDTTITQEEVSKLFDIFEGSDITFGELIKLLRTETINRIENLDY